MKYNYGEPSFMMRYAPGEERIQSGRNLLIHKNPYPIFLLTWTLGRQGLANDFNFNKIESLISFQKNILGYGRSSLRIQAGYLDRALPYHKMFVGRGGLRNFTVVFHNTFETMGYNEFLSDRYLYFFYSHNFGPFFIPFLNHFSSLEMQHNIGIGDLRNKNIHGLIEFEVMNKGYLESGLFMNDIILLNASGLKTGLGAGFFYRYGAYQNPEFLRNVVFKISINLDL